MQLIKQKQQMRRELEQVLDQRLIDQLYNLYIVLHNLEQTGQHLYHPVIIRFCQNMKQTDNTQYYHRLEAQIRNISQQDCFDVLLPCLAWWFKQQQNIKYVKTEPNEFQVLEVDSAAQQQEFNQQFQSKYQSIQIDTLKTQLLNRQIMLQNCIYQQHLTSESQFNSAVETAAIEYKIEQQLNVTDLQQLLCRVKLVQKQLLAQKLRELNIKLLCCYLENENK
ncbi:Hypothetical_protein [Hexamita inflata]|uniref:Hypothetical_protein n=1 Tax=Hexamita inflata TaxID=28002 RepID=A0AA86Q8W8_9EUKA|nr:Hypothetical protein HINF_LOCUS31791 [Hexamita inflata]CAI9954704.1 Hypothetical protein HINF_LOCUS42349 [Hexamita inflata]